MEHNLVDLDPFERRHVGSHGAFLLRINHNLVRSLAALRSGTNYKPSRHIDATSMPLTDEG